MSSFRLRLVRAMHMEAGCRLDDAAACADVAIRETREQRNRIIAAAVRLGIPIRLIAVECGMSHPRILQIARAVNESRGDLPPTKDKLPSAA